MDKKNEMKSGLLIFSIFIVAIGIFFSIGYFIEWVYYFAVYLLLLPLLSFLNRKTNTKFVNIIFNVISIPFSILYLLLNFSIPVITLGVHIFTFIFVVCLIPLVIKIIYIHTDLLPFSNATLTFLSLSFISITAVSLYKPILQIAYIIDFTRINPGNAKRLDKLKVKNMTNYVITPQNIRFFIYLCYFFYLFIFSLQFLKGNSSFENQSVNSAIMQAFLVFLAFDNIRVNSKELRLKASEFLPMVLKSIYHSFDIQKMKENKDNSDLPES